MRIQLSRAEYQYSLDGTPVLSFQSLRLSLPPTTYINHKTIISTSELKCVFTKKFNGQHKDDQWNVDKIKQMVTHPGINPVKQGLTSVNKREPVFPFGYSRTTLLSHTTLFMLYATSFQGSPEILSHPWSHNIRKHPIRFHAI